MYLIGKQAEDQAAKYLERKGYKIYCRNYRFGRFEVDIVCEYKDQIINARNFLINHQTDWGVKGENDTKFDGGIGYGGSRAHSDLSNTHRALEALYTTRALATDSGDKKWNVTVNTVSSKAKGKKAEELKAADEIEGSPQGPLGAVSLVIQNCRNMTWSILGFAQVDAGSEPHEHCL